MNRKVDIDKICLREKREQAGLSQQQLGAKIGRSQSQVARIEANQGTVTLSIIRVWLEACGDIELAESLAVEDPYKPLARAVQWLAPALSSVPVADSVTAADPSLAPAKLIAKVNGLVRVPALTCFGPFDSGKSTLLNSLLGKALLPAGWQPVTSAVVFINHVSRRPAGLKDSVYLLGHAFNFALRNDRAEIERKLLASGGLELLEARTRRTHVDEADDDFDDDSWGLRTTSKRSEKRSKPGAPSAEAANPVHYALVYIEHPVLEISEFVDTPGFGKDERDTALALSAMTACDFGIICHPPQSFGSSVYVSIFDMLLKSLPDIADVESPHVLRNLLLPITHAGPDISNADLRSIRNSAASDLAEFCRLLPENPILARAAKLQLKDVDVETAIRERIVPYYANNPDRSVQLKDDVVSALEEVFPLQRVSGLKNFCTDVIARLDAVKGSAARRLDVLREDVGRAASILAAARKKRKEAEQDRRHAKRSLATTFEMARVNILSDWATIARNGSNADKATEFIKHNFPKEKKEQARAQAASLYQAEMERQVRLSVQRHVMPVVEKDLTISRSYSLVADFVNSSGALSASKLGTIPDSGAEFRGAIGVIGTGVVGGTVVASLLTGALGGALGSGLALTSLFPPALIAAVTVAAVAALWSWGKEQLLGWEQQVGKDLAKSFAKSNLESEVRANLESMIGEFGTALERKYGPLSSPSDLSEGEADRAELRIIGELEFEAERSADSRISEAQKQLDAAVEYSDRIKVLVREFDTRISS